MEQRTIRDARPGDLDDVRTLNAANEPQVGPLDEDRVGLFLAHDDVTFRVVADDDGIAGLFVGVVEGVPYGSPNYRWFAGRHPRFAYVDRIALHPRLRGTGVADELYEAWAAMALDRGRSVVCAEVNVEPPNERSLRFHARHGFTEVGRTSPHGDDGEVVAMLERDLLA